MVRELYEINLKSMKIYSNKKMTVVNYDNVVSSDGRKWMIEVEYDEETCNLNRIFVKDQHSNEYLSGHENYKHIFMTDNRDGWEAWYPLFKHEGQFTLNNMTHNTYISCDSIEKECWQTWDENAEDLLLFNERIPLTLENTHIKEITEKKIKRKYTKQIKGDSPAITE